jgi:hypothetical protein
LFEDAARLNWYSLVRPFDRIIRIRDMAADVETVAMRLANLIAKSDGQVTPEETTTLRTIQQEIEVHIKRLSLDDDDGQGSCPDEAETPPQIVHQQSTLQMKPASSKETAQSRSTKRARRQQDTPQVEQPESADTLEQALADLQQLVGLEQIKREIATLTNYLHLQQHRQAAGLPMHPLSLHMVFHGNPGTGKTTVARIVGRILKALSLLKKGHLIETDRSGLVAEYAGQTATKTNRKIDEALDGILFIDEAYSLVSAERTDAYGLEAIQALVKRMEDDRQRLVVILAGYPLPMQQLLHSNPGLSSRFNTQMLFEDYNAIDLCRIFQRMCEANHYVLPPDVRAKLLLGFAWLYRCRDEHFGNGRLARNVFENSVRRLADRVAGLVPVTRELLTVLTADDIALEKVPEEIWRQLDQDGPLFTLDCPECSKTLHVRTRHLGTRVRCPHCRSRLDAQWGAPQPS